jgi:hypothetical protein
MVLLGSSCDRTPSGDAAKPSQGPTVAAVAEGATLPNESEEPSPATSQVIAYYFHNTIRCVSCLEIERIAREAIEEKFANELDLGRIQWHLVNMELDENNHFITDYDLTVPSLVYSRIEGKKQVTWQKLDQVWDLLDDPGALGRYVQNELSKCLRAP